MDGTRVGVSWCIVVVVVLPFEVCIEIRKYILRVGVGGMVGPGVGFGGGLLLGPGVGGGLRVGHGEPN